VQVIEVWLEIKNDNNEAINPLISWKLHNEVDKILIQFSVKYPAVTLGLAFVFELFLRFKD